MGTPLKICFLLGCLEPGKDGVGDYTRLLAESCRRSGHSVRSIALNDSQAKSPVDAHGDDLRLSSNSTWGSRFEVLAKTFQKDRPDWISLQFVPYGFHPKGLIRHLIGPLSSVCANASRHVMFHEIWIGAHLSAPWKHRLMGFLQRRQILALTRRLCPQAIHTSNPAYQQELARHGLTAGRLPLFGNVPQAAGPDQTWFYSALKSGGLPLDDASRGQWWLFGFFGSLHPVWPPEPFFSQLRKAADKAGKRVGLIAMGRIGSGEALWEEMSRRYQAQFTFAKLGELPAGRISQALLSLDFGVAASPLSLIGKSATYSAMVEHGLPVVVNRDEVHFRNFSGIVAPVPPGVIRLNGDFAGQLTSARRSPGGSSLPAVTREFLSALADSAVSA